MFLEQQRQYGRPGSIESADWRLTKEETRDLRRRQIEKRRISEEEKSQELKELAVLDSSSSDSDEDIQQTDDQIATWEDLVKSSVSALKPPKRRQKSVVDRTSLRRKRRCLGINVPELRP